MTVLIVGWARENLMWPDGHVYENLLANIYIYKCEPLMPIQKLIFFRPLNWDTTTHSHFNWSLSLSFHILMCFYVETQTQSECTIQLLLFFPLIFQRLDDIRPQTDWHLKLCSWAACLLSPKLEEGLRPRKVSSRL